MTDCRLVCVNPAEVKTVWPKVRPMIYAAMKRGNFGALSSVEDDVLNGDSLLWLAHDDKEIAAACISQIGETEWRKVCTIVACGGTNMNRWLGLLEQIEAYARAEGCSATRIIGRDGWSAVLPDYRHHRAILEKDLRDGR
jgi:hypothetical protein